MSTVKTPKTPELSRRRLMLAGAGSAGALAVAAAVVPAARDAVAPAATEAKDPAAERGGYQVTQHVLRYYATARV